MTSTNVCARRATACPSARCELDQCLVLLEILARALKLTDRDQRLDRVRPGIDRAGRPMTHRQKPCRKVANVTHRGLVVAERELERTERRQVEDREDLVADRLRACQPTLGGRAGLLYETDRRLGVGSPRANHPFVLPLSSLLGDLVRRDGVLKRPRQMTGVVLQVLQVENDPRPRVFVATRQRACSSASSTSRARSRSSVTDSRCSAKCSRGLSWNSRGLSRRSSMATPRSSRPGVISSAHVSIRSDSGERHSHEPLGTDPLGALESVPGIDQRARHVAM